MIASTRKPDGTPVVDRDGWPEARWYRVRDYDSSPVANSDHDEPDVAALTHLFADALDKALAALNQIAEWDVEIDAATMTARQAIREITGKNE